MLSDNGHYQDSAVSSISSTRHAHFPLDYSRLACGLRVVLQPDRRIPLVASQMCYLSGSKDETPELCGLAHLCEHLASLDLRSNSSENFNRLIEQVGGVTNGSTYHERTAYTMTLPSQNLALCLWAEATRMSGCAMKLSQKTLDVQRAILLQEHRLRVENRPYGRSLEILQQLLYSTDDPYHRMPAGSPEGLRSISRDDVEEYFLTNFRPDKAILVLVGDFSFDKALEEVERYLGVMPIKEKIAERDMRFTPKLSPLEKARHEVIADRVPFARTYLAFRAPGYGHRGCYTASLLVRSLSVGRSSPLQRKLVQELGIAQEVQAQMIMMWEASTVAITATAVRGIDHKRLEAALVETLDDILLRGIPDMALQRAQKKALTDHYATVQRLDRRADFLASLAAYLDDPARVGVEADSYCQIELDELMDFSQNYCRPERRVLLSFVPCG